MKRLAHGQHKPISVVLWQTGFHRASARRGLKPSMGIRPLKSVPSVSIVGSNYPDSIRSLRQRFLHSPPKRKAPVMLEASSHSKAIKTLSRICGDGVLTGALGATGVVASMRISDGPVCHGPVGTPMSEQG